MKLCNNNNKNNNNKQGKTEKGGGIPPSTEFESKCSVGPASLPVALSSHPEPPQGEEMARAPPTPQNGLSPPLLTGALLPQSSEMERRLKMGSRRPGSRLGDSEPLRLPELREPLK